MEAAKKNISTWTLTEVQDRRFRKHKGLSEATRQL